MNKDDEFELNNVENDDDARAVQESELLPIFEAMSFSGDIQPLEDFEIPEPEKVEYQQKKKSDTKNPDRKAESVRPAITFKKIVQIVIAAAVVLVVIGAAGFGIYTAVSSRQNVSPVNTIYTTGKTIFLNLDDERSFEINDAENIIVSKDSTRVYFCKATSSKTGVYDIKLIDTSKKASLKRGGSVICIGADEDWQVNGDGTLLCYSKVEKGVKKHFLYNAADGKTVEISSEVEEVFLPTKGDVIYYTRRVNTIYSLHRMKYGEESAKVASEVSFAKFYDSDEGSEILYTMAAGDDGEVDVFSVKGLDNPAKICSCVSEVYLNDYVYGGNLYYFTKKTSAVNWQDFIYDNYLESDGGMKKPEKSDYMIEYGFLIKRYILDESAFAGANNQYNNKLKRDAIREALDKLDLGLDVGSTYDCHVYNAFSNQTLATGIYLNNLLAFSATGAPRVVVRKSVINVDDKITMDKLMSITVGTDTTAAIDYVRKNVGRSFSVSNDCIYSWFDGNKVLQYSFTDYKKKNTVFYTASSTSMYGFFDGRLYCDEITSSEFGKPQRLGTKVTDCAVYNGFMYYQKPDDTGTGLFRFSPETGEQYLGTNVSSYVVMSDDCVILLSVSENTQALMNMSVFDGSKTKTVDTDISINHFIYNGSTVAYLKISSDDSSRETGDMFVWTAGGEPESYGSDISDIKYIKDLKQ